MKERGFFLICNATVELIKGASYEEMADIYYDVANDMNKEDGTESRAIAQVFDNDSFQAAGSLLEMRNFCRACRRCHFFQRQNSPYSRP